MPKLGACVRQIDALGEPTGLAYGPDGLLYVAESLAHRVNVIDAEGKSKRTIGAERLVDPRDVAVCADGRVVVSDAGLDAIVIFAPDGKSSVIGKIGGEPGQFSAPEGIDVAGDWIAVADSRNDRVQVMKLDGSLARVIGYR
ncbi:NHL repeat-containing protein, partial [Chamaesiphon sp. OTE_75_metabat_556]|uniref:NHL repeat-containing protein n=1 Tax=Chamaesiphon sp. OTE_75_metabat_556 TaxID=2964692 RepID=UPI00286CE61F